MKTIIDRNTKVPTGTEVLVYSIGVAAQGTVSNGQLADYILLNENRVVLERKHIVELYAEEETDEDS